MPDVLDILVAGRHDNDGGEDFLDRLCRRRLRQPLIPMAAAA
jgi:hypothetical protein